MRHLLQRLIATSLTLLAAEFVASSALARDIEFGERVKAQLAILKTYQRHQIGGVEPREPIPYAVAERQVVEYLKQSAALEKLWSTPITAEMLDQETDRIAKNTGMPDRLEELYSALGHDPVLVRESLVRPVLANRLLRQFFSSDARIHGEEHREAARLREKLIDGELDPGKPHPLRSVVEWRSDQKRTQDDERLDISIQRVESELLSTIRARLRAGPGGVGEIVDYSDRLEVQALLAEDADSVRASVYTIQKVDLSQWWEASSKSFDESAVHAVADSSPLPSPSSAGRGVPCQDYWDNGSLDYLPNGILNPTAVWTGGLAIYWGSHDASTGGRYDPATNTWSKVSTVEAPDGSSHHVAVWTGTEMIVWGGVGAQGHYVATGGRYDPVTDTWRPTSTIGAPEGRAYHAAIWSGHEMIVWGGINENLVRLNDGGRYDPVSDTWLPITATGAPQAREGPTAVWTGTQMLVWGGADSSGARLGTGGAYDPSSDSWSPITPTGAPSPRIRHTAVWTGSRMIVWGGTDDTMALDTGSRYDPVSDSWSKMATRGAPSPRLAHSAVWSGDQMIVWGGQEPVNGATFNTGGLYDPGSNKWQAISTLNAPSSRANHGAVFGAGLMIVWGGDSNTGGRYDPITDTWTPTTTGGAPEPRTRHSAVWTGTHMIVWGGGYHQTDWNSGSRYDPVLDAWFPTTTIGAPAARSQHSAVWTGSRMIVWGGKTWGQTYFGDGSSYDPVGDSWTPISNVGAPSPRAKHTAVWTGSQMIVWSGEDTYWVNTGGVYTAATNSWAPMTTANAPSPREAHPIWTGSLMIVWSGTGDDYWLPGTGARYDPATDTWTPTSTVGVPIGRTGHSAVWTGTRMIVWGGQADIGWYWRDGASYDPVNDTWQAIDHTGAPWQRLNASAVWTGRHMLVWGGECEGDIATSISGGLYDPLTDRWSNTTTVGVPKGRALVPAVWTGSHMIVWGQTDDINGGRYVPDESAAPAGGPIVSFANATSLSWSALEGATVFDAVKGSLGALRQSGGDFSSAILSCLADDTSSTTADDTENPLEGDGFWYLVRGVSCGGPGTYDDGGAGQIAGRDAEIAASASACP